MINLDQYIESDFQEDVGEDSPPAPPEPEDTGYRTNDYICVVSENRSREDVYQLVNRVTGVLEYEDHFLPRTINMMMELQGHLDDVKSRYWKGNIKLNEGEYKNGPPLSTSPKGGSSLY